MKVIHIPYSFYPDPVGGTEIYVESLARNLHQRGVTLIITAPGEVVSSYEHNGLRVRRFAVSNAVGNIRALYGDGDALAAQEFTKILDEEQPDIIHLHAFTRGASLRLVREARHRGIKVVFTYHTPTVSCQRGTLMRWGTEICDGVLDVHRCSACTLHALGVNKVLALALGSLPVALSSLPGKHGLSGGMWTALRMVELVELRHASFRALMEDVDHVVVLCQWTKDLLVRNGVPAGKITLSRHGLAERLEGWEADKPTSWEAGKLEGYKIRGGNGQDQGSKDAPSISPLRIAFLGRLDPTKGLDILIRAVRSMPSLPVELHVYGIAQSGGDAYLEQLKRLADKDRRIRFLPPVASSQVIQLLRAYDLVAVPSRCLETGPLVVLEAFAAGIPVIGSNLGGIAELVDDGVNGLLAEPDSQEAWNQALGRLSEDQRLLERLRAGIRPPRSMKDVAQEMLALYGGLGGAGRLKSREPGGTADVKNNGYELFVP